MTRRQRWCLVVGLAVLLAVFANHTFRPFGPRPSLATFNRVGEGMTREQVIRAVGGRPMRSEGRGGSAPLRLLKDTPHDVWGADDGMLEVWFDEAGRADVVFVTPVSRGSPPGPFGRVRAWLGI